MRAQHAADDIQFFSDNRNNVREHNNCLLTDKGVHKHIGI